MKKIILLNLLFFVLLMGIFLVAALGMGYAANNKFGTDAGILYILIVVVHLFINYLIMHKKAFPPKNTWYMSGFIACIYLLILFH